MQTDKGHHVRVEFLFQGERLKEKNWKILANKGTRNALNNKNMAKESHG